MELDDFKSAWQTLDKRLERQNSINWQLLRDGRLAKTRASLRPLFWGQILQMVFGVAFILLAVRLWKIGPDDVATIIAGVTVHAYGVACILMAGVVLGGISKIEYAAPVLEIQTRLARVRRSYVISGMVVGLPWWFLWVPILMLLLALVGADLTARAPSVIWIGLGVGAAGLLFTAWLHRWSRNPARPRIAKAMEAAVTGSSLRKAQAQLEELRRFEQE